MKTLLILVGLSLTNLLYFIEIVLIVIRKHAK